MTQSNILGFLNWETKKKQWTVPLLKYPPLILELTQWVAFDIRKLQKAFFLYGWTQLINRVMKKKSFCLVWFVWLFVMFHWAEQVHVDDCYIANDDIMMIKEHVSTQIFIIIIHSSFNSSWLQCSMDNLAPKLLCK